MNRQAYILLVLMAPLFGCGPGQVAGDPPVPAPDPIELSCANFCAIEQVCVAPNLRDAWEGFETEQECTDYCAWIGNSEIEAFDKPECVGIITAMWDCGAELATCDEFEWFDWALGGLTGLNNSACGQQIYEFFMHCNG